MNKHQIISTSLIVLISAFTGTIFGNFPNYLHPSIGSHSELYAAILGALLGSIVGGLGSFLLSYNEIKAKLIFEKTKLYDQLSFSSSDLISTFQTTIENIGDWNKPEFKNDALKRIENYLELTIKAQDSCGDLLSPEMAILSHCVNVISSKILEEYFETNPLPTEQIRHDFSTIDLALRKMHELTTLECDLSRSILNGGFIQYIHALTSPNKQLLNWKTENKTYLIGLNTILRNSKPKQNFPQTQNTRTRDGG